MPIIDFHNASAHIYRISSNEIASFLSDKWFDTIIPEVRWWRSMNLNTTDRRERHIFIYIIFNGQSIISYKICDYDVSDLILSGPVGDYSVFL